MNNSLKESIHLFINIILFTALICRTVKRRKKRSGISRHRIGKVKKSKTSHLPIPQSVVTETMPPRLQASHTKQSIQRKLNSSKRKGLRDKNTNPQAQGARNEASAEKKASNAIVQAAHNLGNLKFSKILE